MQFDIITIFPEMFAPILNEGVLRRAQLKEIVKINVHDLRKWTYDSHKTVDDRPFGGGPGMVMKPEPIFEAVEEIQGVWSMEQGVRNMEQKTTDMRHETLDNEKPKTKIIILSPQGRQLNQSVAQEMSQLEHLILICGRYEGVDQRVIDHLVDDQISIGNYILSGGELPAMVLVDTVTRLIPGVLGNPESLVSETFNEQLTTDMRHETKDNEKRYTDYPVYTQPRDFRGMKVPDILLTGDHGKIAEWRRSQR